METEKKPAWRWQKIVFFVVIACLAAVFVLSAIKIGSYWYESRRVGGEYDELAGMKEDLLKNPPADDPGDGEGVYGPRILPVYKPFYQMNNDMVGWITVYGTKVDYPVMQTPGRPDYYLKRTFYGKWSDWGAIYAREACDVIKPSDNVVLYGHHMDDGSMFASLERFAEKSFWEEYQTISFDTLYEHREYQVWAVFKTSAVVGKGFAYHKFNDAKNQEEFDSFVQSVKELAYYDTGITPQYGDKLLTLSTCEYTLEEGRFVVCAVLLPEEATE